MRRIPLRQQIVISLYLTCVIQISTACGGGTLLKSFRVALAASGPLVNSLVATGAIPENKASAIIADFDAGAQCGLTLQNEFATAQNRADKFAASSRALICFRAITDHHNFASNPRVQKAANIAEGILASLVAFYSDTADPSAAVAPVSEAEFEKKLEKQTAALKAAMKP